jgi:hypothetical protein
MGSDAASVILDAIDGLARQFTLGPRMVALTPPVAIPSRLKSGRAAVRSSTRGFPELSESNAPGALRRSGQHSWAVFLPIATGSNPITLLKPFSYPATTTAGFNIALTAAILIKLLGC